MNRKYSNKILLILLFYPVLIFYGCYSGNNQKSATVETGNYLTSEEIRYAKIFNIDYFKEYTKVTVNNPWMENQEPYRIYYLIKSDSVNVPKEGVKIKIPITSIAVNTFSYFEFLSLIGLLETVKGVIDGHRI